MTAEPLHDIQGRSQDIGEVCVPVLLKRGASSIHLCHEQGRWWVFSTVWDNQREGVVQEPW